MAKLFASIRHNLARVADFSGRESRGSFWPYAIVLFLVEMALSYLAMVPVFVELFDRLGRFVAENPDKPLFEPPPADGAPALQPFPPELVPDMTLFMQISAAINGLFVLLIAAAAVRRLHDRDRTGLWALIPLPFWISGWIIAWWIGPHYMFTGTDARLLQLSLLNSLAAWGSLIGLVVLLAGEGTKGPNRFGPDLPPA